MNCITQFLKFDTWQQAFIFLIPKLQTEEEIGTLKQVLQAKEQYAAEIRKELGITPLAQLKAEINKVQSSQA